MSRLAFRVVVLSLVLGVAGTAFAQFGHPLKGSWSGQWGPPERPNRLLLRLDWDGKQVSGVINPGDSSATIKSVTVDYVKVTAWRVRMEAEGRDASGKPVPIVVDGTLENLGAYYRLFHGTWSEGGRKGPFTLTHN